MNTSKRYSPEVRERAVRMVLEHEEEYSSQWAAIESISEKFGCTSETLRRWLMRDCTDTFMSMTSRSSLNTTRIALRCSTALFRIYCGGFHRRIETMPRIVAVLIAIGCAAMALPANGEGQSPTDDVSLFQAAYEALLQEQLPPGKHGVVDDAGVTVAEPPPRTREATAEANREFAEREGLRSANLEQLMLCEERAGTRPGCPVVDDLVALVAFTVNSTSPGSAVILAEVWKADDEGRVPILGGYKGYWVRLIHDGNRWIVEKVSVFIDS